MDANAHNQVPDSSLLTRVDTTEQIASLDIPFETLGAYKILEVLGRGGMGIVFKAQHQHLSKIVAIKILPKYVTERPAAVIRFRREMKAVGAIEHPHLVQAFDAGEIDGTHYIAMEYIAGVDLYHLVKNSGPTSVAAACAIVYQVAQALSAAHQAGIVHRDIKPANLMISTSGQVKLLDLGLARLLNEEGECTELTSLLHTIGTPDYMAPEQWDNVHNVNAGTDLYALGCVFHFLLVGSAPYSAPHFVTPSQKMKGHLLDPIPDLMASRPEVPLGIVQIFQKMMAKEPEDRFEDAEALIAALLPYQTETSLGSLMKSGPAPTQEIPLADLPSRDLKPRRKPFRRIIVASLLAGAIGIGAIWSLIRDSGTGGGQTVVGKLPAPDPVQLDRQQEGEKAGRDSATPVSVQNAEKSGTSALVQSVKKPGTTEQEQLPRKNGELQLWKLIGPKTLSDGRREDVRINGENLNLDASQASKQLWLDFQDQNGLRLSGKMRLRILNPDRAGYFKIVLLPRGGKPTEYYVLLHKHRSTSKIAIADNTARIEHILASHPLPLTQEAIDLEFNFEPQNISVRVGKDILIEAPRISQVAGTVAIAVHGWRIELERPTARIE